MIDTSALPRSRSLNKNITRYITGCNSILGNPDSKKCAGLLNHKEIDAHL